MSNALAIAAVTKSLVNLITNEIAADPQQDLPTGIRVTAQPPDAANNDTTNTYQVNLFLYHVLPNAAWRNMPLPNRAAPGEDAQPPLALNLYYLITVYTRETGEVGDIDSHNLLGRVMRVLYDHPVLSSSDITLPVSDVQNQIERIRITLQPLNIEEIYRLWTGFQTQYRLSVSYEVSVILIESSRAIRTPLPVLKIGPDGRGPTVIPDILPYPVLFSVQLKDIALPAPPGSLGGPSIAGTSPVALPGDTLVIQGHRLSGQVVNVSFVSLQNSIFTHTLPPDRNDGNTIDIKIPNNQPDNWPAGFYTLSVVFGPLAIPDQLQTTNSLIFALAPQIDTSPNPPITVTNNPQGGVFISLNSARKIQPGQRVTLLLNDQELTLANPQSLTNPLSFSAPHIQPANRRYTVRLRVDGVDSIPFVRDGYPQKPWDPYKNPPQFDPNQQVRI